MFENQVYLIYTKFLILRLTQRRQWDDKVPAWYTGLSKIDYIMLKVKVLHYRYPPVTLAGFGINLIPLRKITTDRSFCIRFCSFLLYSMLRNYTYYTKVFPLKLPQCWGRDARNMYMCYTGRLMTVRINFHCHHLCTCLVSISLVRNSLLALRILYSYDHLFTRCDLWLSHWLFTILGGLWHALHPLGAPVEFKRPPLILSWCKVKIW